MALDYVIISLQRHKHGEMQLILVEIRHSSVTRNVKHLELVYRGTKNNILRANGIQFKTK